MKYEVVFSKSKKRKEWMDGELLCSNAERCASLFKLPSDSNIRGKKRKIAEARLPASSLQVDEEIQIENYLVIIQAPIDSKPQPNNSTKSSQSASLPSSTIPEKPRKPQHIPQVKTAKKAEKSLSKILKPQRQRTPLSTDDIIALLSNKIQHGQLSKDRPNEILQPEPSQIITQGSNLAMAVQKSNNLNPHKPSLPVDTKALQSCKTKKDPTFKVPILKVKSSLGQLRFDINASPSPKRREATLAVHDNYALEKWRSWMRAAILEEIQLGIDMIARDLVKRKPQPAQMYRKAPRKRANWLCQTENQTGADSYFLYGSIFSDNQKEDAYFVSKTKDFSKPQSVWLFVSDWHGSTDEAMQVRPLSTNFSKSQVSSVWNSKTKVFVLKGLNVAHHLGMLQALESFTLSQPSIAKSILSRQNPVEESHALKGLATDDAVHSGLDMWLQDLNEDQQKVLQSIAAWFTTNGSDPVMLVHGIFGSGKTKLLVTAVLFLLEILDHMNASHIKICITSATNNAVDKILLALESAGLDEMIRVGSKKVHRRIRKYTAQTCPEAKVVGITCCASSFKHINDLFAAQGLSAITFVDECFQIPEALSILSLAYANTSHLILLGDPKQLPPVSNLNTTSPNKLTYSDSLYKRLELMGRAPSVLRKQYRCHPDIGALASTLFYNSCVINGTSASDRPSLLGKNPALIFKDTGLSRELRSRESVINPDEQSVIVQLVRHMVQPSVGVSPAAIGVIALYRAQAFALQRRLETYKVEASTVDAFQGQEKDIIIVSPCRNHASDFSGDRQRLNVMLTRARHHFILVGNVEGLRCNPLWKQVIRAMSPLQSF